VEAGPDSAPGLRIQPFRVRSDNLSVADDSASLAPRVIRAKAMRTLARRDPGGGSWWALALAGLGADILLFTYMLDHLDWR
jgi:hypothetical protein